MHQLLTDHDLDLLEEAVHEILVQAGMKVCSERILRRLQDRGAEVDLGAQTVRFTASTVDEVLAMQRASAPGPGGGAARLPVGTELYAGLGYDIAPRIYEFPDRRPRRATRRDLQQLIDLGDALPEVKVVGCPVVMGEVDARVESIESFAEIITRTNKPPSTVSILPEHNPYFLELGEIALGPSEEPRFIGVGGFLITPLTINDRLAALLLEGEKYAVKGTGCSTMAIQGLSAPASIAGTVALAAAEIVGGWVVAHAANPHATSFTSGTATGILDMRTTKGCFGTPESALQDAAIVTLFRERLGGHVHISGAGYIDATAPGLQAVYEKLTKAHVFSATLGNPLRIGNPGLIDAGALYSPAQFVLELEMNAGLVRSDWEVPVTEELIALDDILALGPGESRNFLQTDHTLKHCRDPWYPRLLDKGARTLADGVDEEQLLARAHEYWRDVVASHELPEIDEERKRAAMDVVARARRELLG